MNQKLVDVLCRLMKPQEVDLHFDAKVITVYGDQEGAELGYTVCYIRFLCKKPASSSACKGASKKMQRRTVLRF